MTITLALLLAILIAIRIYKSKRFVDRRFDNQVRKMYQDIAVSRQEAGEIQQVVLMSRSERKKRAKDNGIRFAPIHQYRGSRDKGWDI